MVSCSGSERDTYNHMLEIEEIVDQHPDSALALLKDMGEPELGSDRNKAMYQLLTAQAKYKNMSLDAKDSLINFAVEYFSKDKDSFRAMKSNFLLSKQLYLRGSLSLSAMRLSDALTPAQQIGDPYWLAYIHDQCANLYYESYNIKEIINQNLLAAHYFKEAGMTQKHFLELVNAADAYPLINESGKGLALLDSIKSQLQPTDSFMNAVCLQSVIPFYNRNCEYDKSRKAFTELLKYIDHTGYRDRLCAALAQMYLKGYDNPDSAKVWIDRGLEIVGDDRPSEQLINAQVNYYERIGDKAKTVELLWKYIEQEEMKLSNTFDQDFTVAQKEFYNKEANIKARQAKTFKAISIVLAVLLIVAVVTMILYSREKAKRKNLERYKRMTEINQLVKESKMKDSQINKLNAEVVSNTEHLNELNDRLSRQQDRIEELSTANDDIFSLQLNTVNILCDNFFGFKTSDVDKRVIYTKVDDILKRVCSSDGMKKLIDVLNKSHSGIIQKLRSQLPNLSESDLEFIILIYCGIKPKTVCVLLNISASYFYTRRKRIIARIEKSDAKDKQLFIDMLMLQQDVRQCSEAVNGD